MVSWPISNGHFTTTAPSSYTPEILTGPGGIPVVSANGTKNGIVWLIATGGAFIPGGEAYLHAYDALNLGKELYDSSQSGERDYIGLANKYAVATVANGKVYAGAVGAVGVFGLGKWPVTPEASLPSGGYPTPFQVSLSDATPGTSIHYTLDGSMPTPQSPLYTGPVTISTNCSLSAKAFFGSAEGSPLLVNFYTINPSIGTGTGLFGSYYKNQRINPTGTPTATRVDPTINFDWEGTIPITGLAGKDFGVIWTGSIQAETTGTYTFRALSADGVQVFIGSQLLINDYTQHGRKTDAATINMVSGQTYPLTIKYYTSGATDIIQLFWQAAGIPMQIVPQSQLYPATSD